MRRAAAALAAIAALVFIYGLHWYLSSPTRVVHLAFSALHRGDASALVALASGKERRLMNLTPTTVGAYLRETWWRAPAVRPRVTTLGSRLKYADIAAYLVEVSGFPPDRRPKRFELEVYQDASGVWRLGLSELLYCLPKVCRGAQGDYAREWDAMARHAGLYGVVCADGGTRYTDGSFSPEISLTHN